MAIGACSAGLFSHYGFVNCRPIRRPSCSRLVSTCWIGVADHEQHAQGIARKVLQMQSMRRLREPLEDDFLTASEADTVLQLRMRLADSGVQQAPNSLLQRACMSAEGDIEAAYAKVREVLNWRRWNKVDGLLADSEAVQDEREWYRKLLHYELCGPDRKGRTVMVEAVGRWDMKAIDEVARQEGQMQRMVQAHTVVCELLLQPAEQIRVGGDGIPRARGFVAVLDMAGISMKQNPLGYPQLQQALKEISTINARYYPQAVEHVFVVNTPLVFDVIWRVVARMALPSSGGKVSVLRKGDYSPLVAECGRGCLPAHLGGRHAGR